jgi:hypothetical protein
MPQTAGDDAVDLDLLELRKWREERIFPLDRRSSLTEKEE